MNCKLIVFSPIILLQNATSKFNFETHGVCNVKRTKSSCFSVTEIAGNESSNVSLDGQSGAVDLLGNALSQQLSTAIINSIIVTISIVFIIECVG